jgi:thioredoxin-like negative regulator of GroEL
MSSLAETLYQKINWIVGIAVLGVVVLMSKQSSRQNIEPSTDLYFQSAVATETRPVLVKFGATWCPPCVSTDAALKEFQSTGSGAVKVVIIDVDSSPELAAHYRVRGIPHSFIFRNGKVVDDRVGGMDVEEIRSWVNSNVH